MQSQMPGPREKLCHRAGWRCGQVVGVRRRYSKIDCNDEQRVESCRFGGPFEIENRKDARNQRGSDVLCRKPAVNVGTKRLYDGKYSKPLQSQEENGESCKEVQGSRDGQMLIDCQVPVDRTPTGYRVPGFLRFEILLRWEIRQHTRKLMG